MGAKADADPYLLYGGYGYGLRHYGYARYYGHPYTYFGKRSADADAEAKADADPYLLYGGYGYGHLGYRGYYGYPHGGCLPWINSNHQSNNPAKKMDKTTINVFFFSDNIFQCLDSVLSSLAGNKENQNIKKSIMN